MPGKYPERRSWADSFIVIERRPDAHGVTLYLGGCARVKGAKPFGSSLTRSAAVALISKPNTGSGRFRAIILAVGHFSLTNNLRCYN